MYCLENYIKFGDGGNFMKKKIFIVILIVFLLVIAHFCMYLIDMNRMKNNKSLIFSNWGYSYVPPINLLEK